MTTTPDTRDAVERAAATIETLREKYDGTTIARQLAEHGLLRTPPEPSVDAREAATRTVGKLLTEIEHGDNKHREWLRQKLTAFREDLATLLTTRESALRQEIERLRGNQRCPQENVWWCGHVPNKCSYRNCPMSQAMGT